MSVAIIVGTHLESSDPPQTLGDPADLSSPASLQTDFKSMYWTSIALFESVTDGRSWGLVAKPLSQIADWVFLWFGFLICFCTIGLFNIVTGFFVDSAIVAQTRDREDRVKLEIKKKEEKVEAFREVFHEMDEDQSGILTWTELEKSMKDEDLQAYFSSLELEIDWKDLGAFFTALDSDGSGSVDIDEFTAGWLRLAGTARMIDMHFANTRIEKRIDLMERNMQEQLDALTNTIRPAGGPSQNRQSQFSKQPEQLTGRRSSLQGLAGVSHSASDGA
eukprot:TRINITY_DN95695_c0_g1_i1.p1 TRINITY_DN95695_c0_g1~~TRINITY_DN95695_c0_g1_i1.p1  ORF type:complete len:292 (+),score=41.89 TRINITY_DN95695_c0_g1_i1:51-878(+)